MKKSLIALAVMAAAGAASAQSSVQLYGIADVWVGSRKSESLVAGKLQGTRQTVVESDGVSDSRWGLKGSEDLGGGLKAVFTLEQGFSLDDGSAASGFNREATVGFQSAFGTIKLGKQYNAFDDVSGAQSTVFDSALAPINNVFLSTAAAVNPSNSIKYISPEFNGFSGSVSYALGEDKAAGQKAGKQYAFSGQYATGPLTVGVGYAKFDINPATAPQSFVIPTNAVVNDYADASALRLNASYNLGVAVLKGSYGRVKDNTGNGKTNEYEIGADVPLASNLVVSGGYAYSKDKDGAVATDAKRNGFGLAVAYILSKRTTAYAGLTQAETENAASGNTTNKTNIYAVGVKHAF